MIGKPAPCSRATQLSAVEWGRFIDMMVGGDQNRMASQARTPHDQSLGGSDRHANQEMTADLSGNPYPREVTE